MAARAGAPLRRAPGGAEAPRREGASVCGARVGSGVRECARARARQRGPLASNSLRREFEGNSGIPFEGNSKGTRRELWNSLRREFEGNSKGAGSITRRVGHILQPSLIGTTTMRAQRNASNKRVATSDKNKNRRVATRYKHNCTLVACLKSSVSCRDFFCRLPASQQMLRAYLSPQICRHTFVATHLSPQHRSCNYATSVFLQHLSSCNIGVTICNDLVTIRAELKFKLAPATAVQLRRTQIQWHAGGRDRRRGDQSALCYLCA